MLLIREVFHCKPGKVRPLLEKFRAMNKVGQSLGMSMRLMTDVAAERYWTVIAEMEVKSLGEFEDMMKKSMENKEFEEAMKGYHEFVDHGRREIYKIES